MRIIPDKIEPHNHELAYGIGAYPHYDVSDTIEITGDEWDIIWIDYYNKHTYSRNGELYRLQSSHTFTWYLYKLIKLSKLECKQK
jgi:hypothetical protein